MECSRTRGIPPRQKIEKGREPRGGYSIETIRRGIVTSQNCERPRHWSAQSVFRTSRTTFCTTSLLQRTPVFILISSVFTFPSAISRYLSNTVRDCVSRHAGREDRKWVAMGNAHFNPQNHVDSQKASVVKKPEQPRKTHWNSKWVRRRPPSTFA